MARRPWRYVALVAPLMAAVLGAGGCGSASEPSPPSGVDELVIPTPAPAPTDFVARIDNPWLPLAPGSVWTYRVTRAGVESGEQTVSVADEPRQIAGVAVSVVDTVGPDGSVSDFYAQDTRGNVWWFGRDGGWRAGQDGAQAGLAMPGAPRVGDGWREALLPGVVEDQASVLALDVTARTPVSQYDGLLEIATSTPLDDDSGRSDLYARDVGLIRSVSTQGPSLLVELVAGP